ncbi:MAG: DoxX family membrane protein [Propionibacteriaceae bacterium]|nr:DoxX family membrane protein [Propionibacteriaceae bacterium]
MAAAVAAGVGLPASVATPSVPEEATVSVPTEAIFRDSPTDPESLESRALSEEEQKLAAERAARRQARVTALAATAPVPVVAPTPVIIHKRTNDKFFGALGLFLLRLVVAGIFAIRGLNILTDIPAAQALFATTIIPEPQIMAIATGVGSLLIALSLLLGLLTRLAGVGIIAIAAGALAFVMWGTWNVFVPGQAGFLGELELLLATVGVVFLLLGAGGWSLDRSFRASRERAKAERAAETPAA